MCDLLIRQQTLQAASVIGVLAYISQSTATVSAPEVDVDETFICCRGGSGEETVAMVEVVCVGEEKMKKEEEGRGTRTCEDGESGFSSNGVRLCSPPVPASQLTTHNSQLTAHNHNSQPTLTTEHHSTSTQTMTP